MYRGLFLLVALLIASVVGGQNTTISRHAYYHVSVRYLGKHICGGMILNPLAVLTAAHCLGHGDVAAYTIRYGSIYIHRGYIVDAYRLLPHEQYNSDTHDYDIGLIFAKSKIKFGFHAKPIDLATWSPRAGSIAEVSDWAPISEHNYFIFPVTVLDRLECKHKYAGLRNITERMICGGVPKGGKHSCNASALINNHEVLGVVGLARLCDNPNLPVVYSNVKNLKPWIEEKMHIYRY